MELKPGYKLTEVGVIPEDWIVQPLARVASLEVGYAFKSSWYRKHNGIPLVRGENVGYGRLDWSDTRRLLEKDAESFSAYLLRPGDIVIGMDRTFTKSGTKISLLQEGDCPCLLVQRVGKFVPLKCNASFLWVLLSSPQFQISLQLEQKGMDIPHLSRSEILQPYVALPPTSAEQEEIATTLSDMDELLGACDRLIAKKRDLKQAAIQQLLSPDASWTSVELEKVADVIDPHPSHRAPNAVSSGIPFVGIGDLSEDGEIVGTKIRLVDASVYEEHHARYDLSEELIGLGRVASIGKVVRLKPTSDKYVISPTLGIIRATAVKREFLLYSLRSKYVTEQFTKIMSGSTRSSVGMVVLRKLEVALPPTPEEQTAIATVLSDMDAEIAALEQRRHKTRALKQAMMQELLTGRIRLV